MDCCKTYIMIARSRQHKTIQIPPSDKSVKNELLNPILNSFLINCSFHLQIIANLQLLYIAAAVVE